MAERRLESTRTFRSTKSRLSSTTQAPMSGDDFVELVWENGQILMRDRLGRTFKVREWRSRYALYPSNTQAEDGGNMHRKRARLETTYSTLKDSTSLDCRDSRDLNYFTDYDYSQTGYHSESSPDLDQQLNLEANRSQTSDDKNSTHPRINVPGPDHDANFKPSNASMFVGRSIPDQLATSRNCHLEPSSFHCQELDTLLGPREKNPSKTPESMAGLHTSNSLEHDLNPNTKTGTVMNFAYLRPEALLKASAPVFTRVQEVKSSNDERPPVGSRYPRESPMIGQASGSKRSATGPANQPEKELIPPVAETQDQSLPHDQHSETFCRIRINLHNSHDQLPDQTSSALAANTPKGKPAVTTSSVCSVEASNDPTYSLRTYEDHTEESEYHLSPPISIALRSCPTLLQKVGEPECFKKKQAPARSCGGGKRSSRTTEVHSLSEKRRREKVKEKMRVLKELIPNCDKVDKVSMLDEAIQYLKTLQLQLQIMSMVNNGAYNMPSIMLPAGMQHFMMNAVPHLTYFSPNMGARVHVGMGCSPLYSPTASQVGATAAPGITGNSIQLMHGFQGQPFPMPVSDASFLPLPQSAQSGTAWPLSSLQDCSPTRPDLKLECSV